jgi:hypothetical protein
LEANSEAKSEPVSGTGGLQALPNINLMISKREDNDKALFLLKAIDADY